MARAAHRRGMPPKKKKSGKKKALAETDPVEFAASERVVRLELELRALRQALALAEGERDERHELSREWRARVDTAEDALEAQQRSTYAVTGDLARQYRCARAQREQEGAERPRALDCRRGGDALRCSPGERGRRPAHGARAAGSCSTARRKRRQRRQAPRGAPLLPQPRSGRGDGAVCM